MRKREMLTKEGFLIIGCFFLATCLKEVLSQDKIDYFSAMCTGTYVEADISDAANGMQRPEEGTRCTEACVVEDGRWGASWCYTDDGDGTMASRQWGAECIQCTGCPIEFATAEVLYCNGACGDDWEDDVSGCQQADADAYCKLVNCDQDQFASYFEIDVLSRNDDKMIPGFGCMYGKEKLDVDFDKFEGTWLGIQDVHFSTGSAETHGGGQVIRNAVCETLLVPGYTFHDNRCCHHLADMNELFSGTVANLAECRSKCDEDDQCLSFEWWGVSNPHPGLGENYCEVSSSCTYELSVYEEDDTLYIRDLYDECAAGVHNCDANAVCIDNPGLFDCLCISGYVGDGVTCTDFDECADGSDNCDANAVCTNKAGGFVCACSSGFTGDGTACYDIDECAEASDDCHLNAVCTNTEGDFTCTCNPGYDGDGTNCIDVDECAVGTDTCDPNARCLNTPGAYGCHCNIGYDGDGFFCAEIPFVASCPAFSGMLVREKCDGPVALAYYIGGYYYVSADCQESCTIKANYLGIGGCCESRTTGYCKFYGNGHIIVGYSDTEAVMCRSDDKPKESTMKTPTTDATEKPRLPQVPV